MTADHEPHAPQPAQQDALPNEQNTPPTQQPAPGRARTNTLAIVALVASFFVGIAGIVCGIIALAQIKRTREGGRGLAIGGIVVGGVQIVAGLAVGILLSSAIVLNAATATDSRSEIPLPELPGSAGTLLACSELKSAMTEWSSDVDREELTADRELALQKFSQLSAELERIGEGIHDEEVSAAVDSAVTELDSLVAELRPLVDDPSSATLEDSANVLKRLGTMAEALGDVGAACQAD